MLSRVVLILAATILHPSLNAAEIVEIPSVTTVSWIRYMNDTECQRLVQQTLDAYTDPATGEVQGSSVLIAKVVDLLCISSNQIYPNNRLDGANFDRFLKTKQTRGIVRVPAMQLVCRDGQPQQLRNAAPQYWPGWTPLTERNPLTGGRVVMGFEEGTLGESHLTRKADPNDASCTKIKVHSQSSIQWYGGGMIGNIALGTGPASVARDIEYSVCCDGSIRIAFSATEFPSHACYVNDFAIGQHLQENPLGFMQSPYGEVAPMRHDICVYEN